MKQVKLNFNMKRTKSYLFLHKLGSDGSGYLYKKYGDCYSYNHVWDFKVETFDPWESDHQLFRTFGEMVGNILDTVDFKYYNIYEFDNLKEVKKFLNPKAMAVELMK